MITLLLVSLILLVAFALGIFVRKVKRTAVGFEDDDGFHDRRQSRAEAGPGNPVPKRRYTD